MILYKKQGQKRRKMQEIKELTHALHFLIKRRSNGGNIANIMSILKLLFFAQRYHLRKYGRLIADDKFVAMKHGPVESLAYDIMKGNYKQIKKEADKDFASEILEPLGQRNIRIKKDIESYDELSDSDIEALEFACDKFGDMEQWQLVDETHKYIEWKKHENKLNETTKQVKMDILDMFGKNPKNSPFDIIPQEKTDINRDFYLGNF